MLYKLTINIKKDYNFDKLNILDFFINLKKSFNVINKEYVFLDNTINFDLYNPKILNCFVEYTIKSNNKNIENLINNFLSSYDFILDHMLSKLDFSSDGKNDFSINTTQISSLVNNIDKLFYIRKELQEMGKYIPKDKQDYYYSIIKNLSVTKYDLKAETFNLRLIDIAEDIKEIETNLIGYAKNLGIDLYLKYNTNNISLDKIVYFNIKPSLVALLYGFVSEEYKRQQKNIQKEAFEINLEFIQNFNKLKIVITNPNIKYNSTYQNIIKNDYFSYKENEYETNLLNFKLTINSLGGRIFIDESCNIIAKIKLNFLTLDCYIIQTELGYFAIDKTQISKIFKYDNTKITYIENKPYYEIGTFKLPIINKINNPVYAIQASVKKYHFIFLVEKILYEEKIFVKPIEYDNSNFIGECLLKDTKKAYILNFATFL